MNENLPKPLQTMLEAAANAMVKQGEHLPQVVFSHAGRLNIAAVVGITDDAAKDRLATYLQRLIVQPGFEWLAFISETWCVECGDPELVLAWRAEHGSLEGYPGRRERLMIYFVDNEVELYLRAPILRDGGQVALGDWEQLPTDREPHLFDRFGGLAQRARAVQQ